MARIVEDIVDSDGEFPDLVQLLNNVKTAPKARRKAADTSRDAEKEEGSRRDRGKRRAAATSSEMPARDEGKREKEEKEPLVIEAKPRPRPRKRVLNQKNGNPLLQPLSASTRSRPSPDLEDGAARAKAKEVKMKVPSKLESNASEECLNEEPEREKRPTRRKEGRRVVSKPKETPKLEFEDEDYGSKGRSKEAERKDSKPVPRAGSVCLENESLQPRKTLKGKNADVLPSVLARKGFHEENSTCLEDQPAKETKPPPGKALKDPTSKTTTKDLSKVLSNKEDGSLCLHNKPTKKTNAARGKEAKRLVPKPKKQTFPSFDSDDEEEHDSDSLSDFIVNDSTFLEDESVVEAPAPRSVRRLVKGRKPRKDDSDDDELGLKMGKLTVNEDPFFCSKEVSLEKDLQEFADSYEADDVPPIFKLPKQISDSIPDASRAEKKDGAPSRPPTSGSEIDNPFTLRFSPPPHPIKTTKTTRFTTPPGSPEPSKIKPRGLISPTKLLQKIPATPHRPSMDAFWQQDVINDWNDEYSPRKTPAPPLFSPAKAKLSPVKPDKAAKDAKKVFEDSKHSIAERFLFELDASITGGKVGELAKTTGGIKIIWSNKLNTTAGRANWKRETIRSSAPSASGTQPPQVTISHRHHASIELASKVITTNSRLLNVIAHEFCHLANFMISNIKTNPHGKEFKAWARKVTCWGQAQGLGQAGGSSRWGAWDAGEAFEVTTKHSYAIAYKFVWECGACGVLYQRHSKSIDPARHQCGTCRGRLVQIRPAPRGGASGADGGEGAPTKGLSAYQMFVKENMGLVKRENPGSPQKEIMGLVGKRYQELKAGKSSLGTTGTSSVVEESAEVGDGEEDLEEVPGVKDAGDEELSGVVRKLDFLDLTAESD